ncbi:MAG: hypothetical protein ABIX28_25700 [Vicinamibacterales bacterium]
MIESRVSAERVIRRGLLLPVIWSVLLLAPATSAWAQDPPLPAPKIGAGLRASFVHTDPGEGEAQDRFLLDSARLYVSGAATKNLSFMFNTEYHGSSNDIGVLDAVAQFSFSPKVNVWVGRFLPPSDRANLYGPYYANHWAVYSDGVQDGYPFVFQGRDNGAMYWGQFGKVKVAGGAFDGSSSTGDDNLIAAGRVQVDFWDKEDGYYLNGTYYGDKNLLAIGGAGQVQGEDKTAYNVDFLLERKVASGGAVAVEAEWAKYDGLGGYNGKYLTNDGGYLLGSYLFPAMAGQSGRFQVLAKYAHARFRDGAGAFDLDFDQDTTELNLNYVMRQFNSRVMLFYKDTRFNAIQTNSKQIGIGLQVQM